jgi:hypothetical protein
VNRVERRVRDMINPYSTAFAIWWCRSSRYWRLPRMITGDRSAARPGPPRPAIHRTGGSAPEGSGLPYLPVFLVGAKPWRVDAGSGFGEADSIATQPGGSELNSPQGYRA